jgi:hypothetical protein
MIERVIILVPVLSSVIDLSDLLVFSALSSPSLGLSLSVAFSGDWGIAFY